jgi:hypothetical protein
MTIKILPGPNYSDKEDVEYFRRKMGAALKVPPWCSPPKTPLLDLTEQVWSDGAMKRRLDRYADYEDMDEYPILQGPYAEDATSCQTPKTPLQELVERAWAEHDETDPPITFDIVPSPSVVGAIVRKCLSRFR